MLHSCTAALALILGLGATPAYASSLLKVDCTGGPYITIQSAIDAALPGDTIYVKACTYSEALVVLGKDNISLLGADQGPMFGARALGAGATSDSPVIIDGDAWHTACLLISDSDNVRFSGFRLNNCSVASPAIKIDSSDGVQIIGNRTDRSGFSTVEVFDSDRPQIIGNVSTGSYWWGVYIDDTTTNALVVDNRIGGPGTGIYVVGGSGHLIENNQVTETYLQAIDLQGGVGTRVQHNTVTGNFGDGITARAGSSEAVIVGNKSQGSIFDDGIGTLLAENN